MLRQILLWTVMGAGLASAYPPFNKKASALRVETFVNAGQSFDMVSSLIIGSEAAVIVDLPLAIPQARALADWVRNTTDKPLVAAFTSHFHPDHYLSGAVFLDQFPGTPFYANAKAVEHVNVEVSDVAKSWAAVFGSENIVAVPTVPAPYNFTRFMLPGNENSPIHLISPVAGDTVDETLFWIPSIKTLIAGDAVIGNSIHVWLTDLLSPALTEAWLSTLDFVEKLGPKRIIPGHAVTNVGFGAKRDLQHTRKYVRFFQDKIESKGIDFFTPTEIFGMLDKAFPGLIQSNTSTTAAAMLNFTANEFGRGGNRFYHHVDLKSYTDVTELQQGLVSGK